MLLRGHAIGDLASHRASVCPLRHRVIAAARRTRTSTSSPPQEPTDADLTGQLQPRAPAQHDATPETEAYEAERPKRTENTALGSSSTRTRTRRSTAATTSSSGTNGDNRKSKTRTRTATVSSDSSSSSSSSLVNVDAAPDAEQPPAVGGAEDAAEQLPQPHPATELPELPAAAAAAAEVEAACALTAEVTTDLTLTTNVQAAAEGSVYASEAAATSEADAEPEAQARAAAAKNKAATAAEETTVQHMDHQAATSAGRLARDKYAAPSSSSSSSDPPPTSSLLVVELFAASYSVGRLMRIINHDTKYTGTRISAYAAVELSPFYHQRCPDHTIIGVSKDRYLNINGSIRDPGVQSQVFEFVQRMLQQSADGSGEKVNGVLVFAAPPCNWYSLKNLSLPTAVSLQQQPQQEEEEEEGEEEEEDSQSPEDLLLLLQQQRDYAQWLQQQLHVSDRIVQSTLDVYRMIEAMCWVGGGSSSDSISGSISISSDSSGSDSSDNSIPCSLYLHTPWSDEVLLAPAAAATNKKKGARRQASGASSATTPSTCDTTLTDTEESVTATVEVFVPAVLSGAATPVLTAAAVAAALGPDTISIPIGLQNRPFLEPHIAGGVTKGKLNLSRHNACTYGLLAGDVPPAAILTDMAGLNSTECACGRCSTAVAWSAVASDDSSDSSDDGEDTEEGSEEEPEGEEDVPGSRNTGKGKKQQQKTEKEKKKKDDKSKPPALVWPSALVMRVLGLFEAGAAQERTTCSAAATAAIAAAAVDDGSKSLLTDDTTSRKSTSQGASSSSSSSSSRGKGQRRSSSSSAEPMLSSEDLLVPSDGLTRGRRQQQLKNMRRAGLRALCEHYELDNVRVKTTKQALVEMLLAYEEDNSLLLPESKAWGVSE